MEGQSTITIVTAFATSSRDSTPPAPTILGDPSADEFLCWLADLARHVEQHLAQAYVVAANTEALYAETLSLLTEIRERYPTQEQAAEEPRIPTDGGTTP